MYLILHGSQASGTFLVHRNSVPSTHMRCMILAQGLGDEGRQAPRDEKAIVALARRLAVYME
jgi:hypothetical protein